MSNQLVTQEFAAYSDEQRRLITDVLCKGATPIEVEFFMQVAQRCRLDPFRRQIHAVKRWDNEQGRNVMTFQVGIDGLRATAARTQEYAGNDEPVFELGPNGLPVKATCTVYRFVKGQRVSFTAGVYWSEYAQTKKDGSLTKMWRERPFGQLGKCAEAAALRKGFPEDASGLYIEEELRDDAATAAPTTRTVSMPVAEEVPVATKPVARPAESRAVDADAEVVSDDPGGFAEDGDNLLADFLLTISEISTAHDLTFAANEQLPTFTGPQWQTVSDAITKRAAALNLTWSAAGKCFRPKAQQA